MFYCVDMCIKIYNLYLSMIQYINIIDVSENTAMLILISENIAMLSVQTRLQLHGG